MADIFSTNNARNLLHKKFVLLLGDSNMRGTYKDLILLLSRNEILNLRNLQKRGEETFEGDQRLVFRGLVKGRSYEEVRRFVKYDTQIEYHFIARCYTSEIETFLQKIKDKQTRAPDVIIMNSCIWDISRWGPYGVDKYKENMKKLMVLLNECLPKETLFIWTTALPISTKITGGLLIKQLDFMQSLLRFEVMEANLFCRHLVVSHGYDVLDTHYYLRMQIHRRLKDGIHYGPLPVRLITNLILTHISLSWNVPLPGNSKGIALDRIIKNGVLQTTKKEDVRLPSVPNSLYTEKDSKRRISPKKGGKFRRSVPKGGPMNKGRVRMPVWEDESIPQNWRNDNVWGSSKPLPQRQQTDNYWNDPRFNHFQEEFVQSKYENFDNAPGPVRRNQKFPTSRHRPY